MGYYGFASTVSWNCGWRCKVSDLWIGLFQNFLFLWSGTNLVLGNQTFDAIAFGACRIEIRTWSFGFVFVSLMDFVLSKLLWSEFKIYSVVWLGWWWYIIRNSSSFLSRWDHEITYVPCKSTCHVVQWWGLENFQGRLVLWVKNV